MQTLRHAQHGSLFRCDVRKMQCGLNAVVYFVEMDKTVDWLLTIPLLLVELLCVMDLPADQLASKGFTLGLAAAAMVALGYPGEIQDDQSRHFIW